MITSNLEMRTVRITIFKRLSILQEGPAHAAQRNSVCLIWRKLICKLEGSAGFNSWLSYSSLLSETIHSSQFMEVNWQLRNQNYCVNLRKNQVFNGNIVKLKRLALNNWSTSTTGATMSSSTTGSRI